MFQILFVVSIFYYTVSLIGTAKKEGCRNFFNSTGNVLDCEEPTYYTSAKLIKYFDHPF